MEEIRKLIKLEENCFLNKIDLLMNRKNDDLLSIEYEVHQILGNLSSYLMLNDRLLLIPSALDKQIDELNQRYVSSSFSST